MLVGGRIHRIGDSGSIALTIEKSVDDELAVSLNEIVNVAKDSTRWEQRKPRSAGPGDERSVSEAWGRVNGNIPHDEELRRIRRIELEGIDGLME